MERSSSPSETSPRDASQHHDPEKTDTGKMDSGIRCSGSTPPEVSVVIPCLNEARTLDSVIRDAREAFLRSEYSAEVIVADNGSSDGSQDIARRAGARVVHVETRGYGAALQGGFSAAAGRILVFADADQTYDLTEAPALVSRLETEQADMAVGSRIRGVIEPGAMPWLHRFLGTPVLTGLINRLYSARLTDCNSGFRAFPKDRLPLWNPRATGMEFASELLTNALKHGARIVEEPIRLRKDTRDREPHLKTWRDGMRHLLLILAGAPRFFYTAGCFFLWISAACLGAFLLWPANLSGLFPWTSAWFVASLVFLLMAMRMLGTGWILPWDSAGKRRSWAELWLALDEGTAFWILLATACAAALPAILYVSASIAAWEAPQFRSRRFAMALYGTLFFGELFIVLFQARLVKRSR